MASCDRAVDSPDVWGRVGDIVWDNQMTGKNTRSVIHQQSNLASNDCRFTLVLTRIDQGLKMEAERHVVGNLTYLSLSSDLTVAETELARLQSREEGQKAKSQQLQAAHVACSDLALLAPANGFVQEPSWWSQIQVQGWTEGPPVTFDTTAVQDPNSIQRLYSKRIVEMTKQLSASLKEMPVLSGCSELVERIQRLKQEMHKCRTDAKVAAIRSKMIEKVADKMAEQASACSQARGDDDFDSDDLQPAAFTELARDLTTVIGVCPPAAIAVLARGSREAADERYDV